MASARKPAADDDITVKDGQALPAPDTTAPVRQADVETNPGPDERAEFDDETEAIPQGDAQDPEPPEPEAVALRALAVAALLRRLDLEVQRASLKEIEALQRWVEDHGLFASFGPLAFELFDAPPGEWTDDDVTTVGWATEELRVLSWSLGLGDAPQLFARSPAEPLLAKLPSAGAPEAIVEGASLRALEELETQRALHQVLHEAARTEAWARAVVDDATLAEGDEELDEIFAVLEEEGVQLDAVDSPQAVAVQALRAWSQLLLERLFGEGSPHAALAFPKDRLEHLDDEALASFLAAAQLRAETLAWLTEGDAFDEEDEA